MRELLSCAALALLLTLSACALHPPQESAKADLILLPPADLGREVLLKQKLVFFADGREKRFLTVARLERERITMLVLTPAGQRLLMLDYDGVNLLQDNRTSRPLPGREMLASLQLSLWPASSIRREYRVEDDWHVEITDRERTLLTSTGPVLIIRRNPGATTLDHFRHHYRVRIETLERIDL